MSSPVMPCVCEDYQTLRLLGRGTFGSVYAVKRIEDGMLFARKDVDLTHNQKLPRTELKILKSLLHENIVSYISHEVVTDDATGARTLSIYMEYCAGGTLECIIDRAMKQRELVPEVRVWRFLAQMLEALKYCHSPRTDRDPVIHRDLKPGNVLLDENGFVKLADFGVSKALNMHAPPAMHTSYVGTALYMSPEMVQQSSYSTKTDIWSLGCIIYEMCALKCPFEHADKQRLDEMIKRGTPSCPFPEFYSSALADIVMDMLTVDPYRRPSAKELLQHSRIKTALEEVAEQRAAVFRDQQQRCRSSPSQSPTSGRSPRSSQSGEHHRRLVPHRPRHPRTRAASAPVERDHDYAHEYVVDQASGVYTPRRRYSAPAGPEPSTLVNHPPYPYPYPYPQPQPQQQPHWQYNAQPQYAQDNGQMVLVPPTSPEQFYHPAGMFYRAAGPGVAGAHCWANYVDQRMLVAQYYVAPSVRSQ